MVVSISYNLIEILELLLRGVSLKHFKIVIPVAYQDLFKKMISFINKEERIPRLQVSIIMIVCLHTWRLPQSQQSVTFSVLEFTWVWGVFYLYQFLRFYHADYNHIENTLAKFQIVDNLWPAMKCQWQVFNCILDQTGNETAYITLPITISLQLPSRICQSSNFL